MTLLRQHARQGIPPDQTTALMARQVVARLCVFICEAGMRPEEPPPEDVSQMQKIIDSREKETALRYRRLASEWLRQWQQGKVMPMPKIKWVRERIERALAYGYQPSAS
jgi:hypothetical protein